jgi:hypothetical protein
MKILTLPGIMILSILYIHSHAQDLPPLNQKITEKSALFSHLPDKFNVNILLIEKLFYSPASGTVRFLLSGNHFFEGVIIEKIQKNKNAICLNIRSSNYDGAWFTLSQITNNDQSVSYIGRIISIRHGDVFMLAKEKGQFYFTKQKQSLLLVE